MYGRCLETRSRRGMKWRRYKTEDGRTITTYELPCAVLAGSAPAAKLSARLESWHRGQARHAVRIAAEDLLVQGTKPAAVAHALNISERHAQRLKKGMK